MKIREVVLEEPSSYQRGKDAMDKILSPSKWLDNTEFKAGYDKGRSAMDRVLDPKQWFRKGASQPERQTPKHLIRQTLVRASAGKPLYQDDLSRLQSIEDSAPDTATRQAIKMAYQGKPLTKEQQQLLATMSKQF